MSDYWTCRSCGEVLFSMSVVDLIDIHRHQELCSKFEKLFDMEKQGRKSGKIQLGDNSFISFKTTR